MTEHEPNPKVRRAIIRLLAAVNLLIAAADEARQARDDLARLTAPASGQDRSVDGRTARGQEASERTRGTDPA